MSPFTIKEVISALKLIYYAVLIIIQDLELYSCPFFPSIDK